MEECERATSETIKCADYKFDATLKTKRARNCEHSGMAPAGWREAISYSI